MSVRHSILLTLLLAFTTSTWAKNYAVYMGGGGEPQGPKTIFDRQTRAMGNFVQRSDWQSDSKFNGGHSTTEQIITDTFGKKNITNQPFTENAYNQLIQDYEEKINKGEITSGDQLMLVIATHGAQKTPQEKTHQISVSGQAIADFNTGAGSSTVSMDKLENLTKLAEQKGIRMAVIDLSCHSGNALPLRNSKTCVISASGPNHYGYGGDGNAFPNKFLEKFSPGKNLEDIFLSARDDFSDRSFPMISTPIGLEINDEIYDSLTPYLYNYDPKYDKFTGYITDQAAKGDACEQPSQLTELLTLISQVESVTKVPREAKYSSRQGRRMKELLEGYYAIMDQLKKELQALSLPDFTLKEKFCEKYDDVGGEWTTCIEYSAAEIMSLDLTFLENHFKKQAEKGGSTQKMMQAQIRFIPQIQAKREAISTQYPDIAKRPTLFKELESKTTEFADKIAEASRELYKALYHQKKVRDTQPNPCKDFVL